MASLTTCNPADDTVAMSVHFLSPSHICCICPITHVFLELAQNRKNISVVNVVKKTSNCVLMTE